MQRAHLRLVDSESAPERAREVPTGDARLIALVRAGDASAATALHDRVRHVIDRTIARLLGRADGDASDLAQQTLVELVSTIDRYRGDCSLETWASTLAAHVVFKHLRRRQTERSLFRELFPDDDVSASLRSSRDAAVVRDILVRVKRHLAGIDPARSWVFILHDVLGHDLREVAQIVGISVAAAQTRLVRGRRELHQRIAADPDLASWLDGKEGGT